MAGYQDRKVWQLGIQITRAIYEITAALPDSEKYGLISQMRRSAVSIPSNIAEGHSRESKREFLQFVSIAKGSLAELETQLIIAKKLGFGDSSESDQLTEILQEEGRMLSGLRRSLSSATKD